MTEWFSSRVNCAEEYTHPKILQESHLVDSVEYLGDRSLDHPGILIVSHHCVSFSRRCLTVCEHSPMVTGHERRDYRLDNFCVNINICLLSRENVIESEDRVLASSRVYNLIFNDPFIAVVTISRWSNSHGHGYIARWHRLEMIHNPHEFFSYTYAENGSWNLERKNIEK